MNEKETHISVQFHPNGTPYKTVHYLGNNPHRLDGPAIEINYHTGQVMRREYMIDGVHHCKNGPAITAYWSDGDIEFEEYYIDGKLSRLDGPAVVLYLRDGSKEKYHYEGGIPITPYQHYKNRVKRFFGFKK